MIDPRWEEQAALQAVGWLDDPAGLNHAAAQNTEVAEAVHDFAEAAALLAYEAPQTAPPAALRDRILRRLETPRPAAVRPRPALISFPRTWMPYALAACLMGLVLAQSALIVALNARLGSDARALAKAAAPRNPFAGMELADLEPQGDHGKAKIMVAWDPARCCGMIHMDDMPPPPAGDDYQLWVLDPSAAAPINAGVVARGASSQHFVTRPVHTSGRPGFAVSLEPAGGRPTPSGSILFAVAPSP